MKIHATISITLLSLLIALPVAAKEGEGEYVQDCTNESQGLTSHYTYMTTSDRPKVFTDNNQLVFPSASVPDIMKIRTTTAYFERGDLIMYFNRGGLCRSISRDNGATWSTPENVELAGLRNEGGAVDPSAIQLRNGKIRLFFYGPSQSGMDPALLDGDHVIFSAVSEDGKQFTVQRKRRYFAPHITDPEVVRLGDLWIMYTSAGQTTHIATSTDGKTFTDTGVTWSGGGIPGAYVHKGKVDIFGCAGNDIMTARSTDGIHFSNTKVALAQAGACDPSPVKVGADAYLFIYKKVQQ